MSLLLIRGANGVTAFRIARRPGPQGTFVMCLNDSTRGFIPNGAGQPVTQALRTLFDHAIQLNGAIQQIASIADL